MQWPRQIELEMDRDIIISRAEAETTTLHVALERYIQEYIPKLSDPKREKNVAQAIQRRLNATRFLASIRGKDVADFIKERQDEGTGANTIRLDLALLSRLFEVAGSEWGDLLPENWTIQSEKILSYEDDPNIGPFGVRFSQYLPLPSMPSLRQKSNLPDVKPRLSRGGATY